MMNCLAILLTCVLITENQPQRVLVLPFMVEQAAAEPWEGLALTLALQSNCKDCNTLVPLTAVRRKLNEYGLSVVTPVSLATRLKLAHDLGADWLVYGILAEEGTQMTLFELRSNQLSPYELPTHEEKDPNAVLSALARILQLQHEEWDAFDLYRLWASTYFAAELETSRDIMTRLLEHEQSGWLFVQEYLDLYGDPSQSSEDGADLVFWRDLFFRKTHYSHALEVSNRVLEARHNPDDFMEHARILWEVGEKDEACGWLKKADSFGFAEQISDQLKECLESD